MSEIAITIAAVYAYKISDTGLFVLKIVWSDCNDFLRTGKRWGGIQPGLPTLGGTVDDGVTFPP